MAIAAGLEGLGGLVAAQEKARRDEALYLQNRVNAAAARDLKIQSLNTRMIQEQEAAAGQKQELAIAALKKAETAKVAGMAAGFKGGSSIDNAVEQFETARLRTVTTINKQTENLRAEIELQKMGADAEAKNRINSMPRGQEPSVFAAVVKTGLGVASGMQTFKASSIEATSQRLYDVQSHLSTLLQERPIIGVDDSTYRFGG